ncbi:MAG TPA: type II toxin-antitoxin system RelE/ParE family toxin [Treponemataceae bacterium]|nr:type II toxin-antitoxin system RelE/ParE family toxin [Treponemataceae bacterium]
MPFRIELSPKAHKQFYILDKPIQQQITKYINTLAETENPRQRGKPLIGSLAGIWRYRIGDYRILFRIEDDILIILVLEIGHRKEVY